MRQPVIVDNKAEWQRIVQSLIKYYDPLRDVEFSLVIIDILNNFLALETFYKLLPKNLSVSIVEELLETLFAINY
jgi:hypothetical protein